MKWKKYAAVAMATMMIAGNAMGVTAHANARDTDFKIAISTSGKAQNTASRRQKEDSSYTYVNYSTKINGSSAYGPAKFRAYVYGSNGSEGTLVDCSSYTSSGAARKPAIVTLGTRGFITQLVREKYGADAYAQLYGSYYAGTGSANGCWSPDSVPDSSAIYYN